MQNPPPVQTAKSSTGIEENIAALLSYVFGWVSGLDFFLIEKDSRLVRFHAMPSILLTAAATVVGIVLWIVSMILAIISAMLPDILGSLIWIVIVLLVCAFYLGVLIAWILCLVKAFQSQYFKLPVIGNFAEKFSPK